MRKQAMSINLDAQIRINVALVAILNPCLRTHHPSPFHLQLSGIRRIRR